MNSRLLDFSDVQLYAVTPDVGDPAVALDRIGKLLAGGVDAVQLRSRHLSDRDIVSLAKKIKNMCEATAALFIMDNRVDLALAADADGVHVGHTDLPVAVVRDLMGHRKIVGVSTHSMPEAIQAQRDGADYVSCGPLWATPTKPEYKPVGLPLVGLYRAALKVPFVAIGGIDEKNIDQVLNAGASCVAVVRALYDAPDPEQAAKRFREKILQSVIPAQAGI